MLVFKYSLEKYLPIRTLFTLIFISFLTSIAFPQFAIRRKDNSIVVYGRASAPAVISMLPAEIPVPGSCVSLFADDRTKANGYAIVYLINNSEDTLWLSTQDGAINIMLEAQDKDGTWKRCQLYMQSFCGNSYYPILLLPGMFTKINGLYPDSGFATKLRYGLYDGNYSPMIESNTIEGLVSRKMIDESGDDPLAIMQGDFNYVKDVALGNKIIDAHKYKYGPYNPVSSAINRLIEFNSDSSFTLLKHIINDKSIPLKTRNYAISNLYRLKQPGVNEFLIGLFSDNSGTPESFEILKAAFYSLEHLSNKETLEIYKQILASKNDTRKDYLWAIICGDLYKERMKLSRKYRQNYFVNNNDTLLYETAYMTPANGKYINSTRLFYLNDSTLFKAFSNNKNDFGNPAIKYIIKGYCLFEPAGTNEYLLSVKNNSAVPDEIRKYADELYKEREKSK